MVTKQNRGLGLCGVGFSFEVDGRRLIGRNDLVTGADDDDIIAHHEISIPAPLRVDFDEGRRQLDHAHARRHDRSDA
jgi:hypothetical protein